MWTLICGMWDLVSWPDMESGSPALGEWSLSHWTTREAPELHWCHGWIIFQWTNILVHVVISPFISRWTSGFFSLWALMNNAAVNIPVYVFVWIYIFNFIRYVLRVAVAGLGIFFISWCLCFSIYKQTQWWWLIHRFAGKSRWTKSTSIWDMFL